MCSDLSREQSSLPALPTSCGCIPWERTTGLQSGAAAGQKHNHRVHRRARRNSFSSMETINSVFDQNVDPHVRGWVHTPHDPSDALILTHGAGGNCDALLLVALAEAFCGHGYIV